MIARTKRATVIALLTMGLAACSRSPEAPPPHEDRVEATSSGPAVAAEAVETVDPAPEPATTPAANLMAEVPPAATPAPDEQMMDDAAATGMTARAARDETPAAEPAPVEPTERE